MFEPWDWVIAASAYNDAFYDAQEATSAALRLLVRRIAVVAGRRGGHRLSRGIVTDVLDTSESVTQVSGDVTGNAHEVSDLQDLAQRLE
jgi:hypothetical protein